MNNGEDTYTGFGKDLLNLAGGDYLLKEGKEAALKLGQEGFEQAKGLAEDVAEMTEFQPYTVVSGTGASSATTSEGGFGITLSPEEQAIQNTLLSGASTLYGGLTADPSVRQAALFEDIRAAQRPEEERQRLALEERMLAQGRLGFGSSAYGGSSSELLAQETARQETMMKANLLAREQAMKEQAQGFEIGTGMLESAYMPQGQTLDLLEVGRNIATIPAEANIAAAEFYGQAGLGGIEALMQGMEEGSAYDLASKRAMIDSVGGLLSSMGATMPTVEDSYNFESIVSSPDLSDAEKFQKSLEYIDMLREFGDFFTLPDYGTPTTGVEEIVPTGYDENGNPTYDY